MKKLASLGGVAGLAVMAALATQGHAADRAPALVAVADPMADITDIYAWMTGPNLNLVMDVSPADDGSHRFGPGVLYVFHITSKPGIGVAIPGGTETQVICRFASNTSVQCWVSRAGAARDYVTGDPSNTAGVTSRLGKIKVFAGRRSDPAFFNASGFAAAVAAYNGFAAGMTGDPAGCPAWLLPSQSLTIQRDLKTGSDAFAAANVMAIVVQLDKSLVNDGVNTAISVWGATHAAS